MDGTEDDYLWEQIPEEEHSYRNCSWLVVHESDCFSLKKVFFQINFFKVGGASYIHIRMCLIIAQIR